MSGTDGVAGERVRSEVLILGCGPLPCENQKMNLAPGFRTWQFAEALVGDGHSVTVVAMRIPGAYESGVNPVAEFEHDGVSITTMDEDVFRSPGAVEEIVASLDPDVVIGASSSAPALRAVEVAGDRPLWIDLFGDLMAEGQARLGFHPDADLFPYRDALIRLLGRGDAFSTVSERQRWAAVGQLGLVGRLNEANRGSRLVHTVPCSVTESEQPSGAQDCATVTEFTSRDVVVLWGGGFNTWCDLDVLFDGMELAMARDDRLSLAVTGGAIGGHDDLTFPRFIERVKGSRFKERFVIKGRLPADEAGAYLERADFGIVTEKDLAERALGSSGRILNWLGRGLPVVCTGLSELGAILAANELVWTYRAGDPDDLARAVLELAASADLGRERAGRARAFAMANWSTTTTMAPVREWVSSPGRASDAGLPNPLLHGLSDSLKALEVVRSELTAIHHSRMWKLWSTCAGLKKRLGLSGKKPEKNRD